MKSCALGTYNLCLSDWYGGYDLIKNVEDVAKEISFINVEKASHAGDAVVSITLTVHLFGCFLVLVDIMTSF